MTLPTYYTSLVRAGEASGSLPQSLSRLADLLEQSLATRERLLSAMIYPIILLLTIGLTLVLIVTFVLPRFEVLFNEAGAQLPL
ncbi:type II secretion system F family protein, partial [Acinetobacter baumannii]